MATPVKRRRASTGGAAFSKVVQAQSVDLVEERREQDIDHIVARLRASPSLILPTRAFVDNEGAIVHDVFPRGVRTPWGRRN